MSKGTRVYSLRIPPDLMHQVKDFVERNQDRHHDGGLTVTKFIVTAIKEKFDKLDRAKRSAHKRQASKMGGVLHPSEEGASRPVSSFADTDLSAGFDSNAVGGDRSA